MAKKIKQLETPTIPLTGGELIEMSQSNVSVKVDINQLRDKYKDDFTLITETQAASANTLSQANDYTDTQSQEASANALIQANDYTDTQSQEASANALNQANDYTDLVSVEASANALIQANAYTDTEILSLSASYDEHNELKNIQGGVPSASEYYHLSQSIHDGLYSASPLIGIGDPINVNLEVDYDNDGHIDLNGPTQIDTTFEFPNSESIISQGSIIGKSNFTEFYSTAHGISPLIKECGICVFKNKIWVVGGVLINRTTKVNTVYSSDDFGRSWTLETGSAFAVPRDEVHLLNFKGYMYAVGGDNGSGLTDVYRTSDGINWTNVGDMPLVSRQGNAIVFNGKMFYYGGLSDDGDNIFYSSDGENWFTATEKLPIGLLRVKSVVYNNALWLIGGATGSPTFTDGVKKVFKSTDGFNFSEIGTDSLPTKIDGCIPLSFQGKMYIIGGQNNVLTTGTPTEKIYESTDGLTWTEVGTDVLSPIASNGSFWLGQGGVVINGRFWFGFGEYLNGDVLDPSTHLMFQNLDSFKLNSGVYVDKVLDEDTMSSNDPNALITQQSAKAYMDNNLALQDDHNELNNIQGGAPSEYYHLTQAIHDGLFSGSPLIGIGTSAGENIQVDQGTGISKIVTQSGSQGADFAVFHVDRDTQEMIFGNKTAGIYLQYLYDSDPIFKFKTGATDVWVSITQTEIALGQKSSQNTYFTIDQSNGGGGVIRSRLAGSAWDWLKVQKSPKTIEIGPASGAYYEINTSFQKHEFYSSPLGVEIAPTSIFTLTHDGMALSAGARVDEIETSNVSNDINKIANSQVIFQFAKGGQTTITSGASGIQVTVIQPDTNYYPVCTIENITDSNPSFYQIIVTAKTSSTFDIILSDKVDSGNYKLNWKLSR